MEREGHTIGQWIEYHRLVGIDHFRLYDVDGSMAGVIADFINEGLVGYVADWRDALNSAMGVAARIGRGNPGLLHGEFGTTNVFESVQKLHCMYSMRGRATWVINLNSYDEYLASSGGPFDVRTELKRFLAQHDSIAMINLPWMSFGGALQKDTSYAIEAYSLRGSPPDTAPTYGGHPGPDVQYLNSLEGSQVVNPDNVLAQHAEMTRGRPGSLHLEGNVDAFLRIQHYVDLHSERCENCFVRDDSALWALHVLRQRVPPPDRSAWLPGLWCFGSQALRADCCSGELPADKCWGHGLRTRARCCAPAPS